jgi:hypothetical protein
VDGVNASLRLCHPIALLLPLIGTDDLWDAIGVIAFRPVLWSPPPASVEAVFVPPRPTCLVEFAWPLKPPRLIFNSLEMSPIGGVSY